DGAAVRGVLALLVASALPSERGVISALHAAAAQRPEPGAVSPALSMLLGRVGPCFHGAYP
ncbi:hypothetical protein BRM83_20805, partial [Xanthomonas oryzae pv. oryzae]